MSNKTEMVGDFCRRKPGHALGRILEVSKERQGEDELLQLCSIDAQSILVCKHDSAPKFEMQILH